MKTCLSMIRRNSIWQECKLSLQDMGYNTVYENESHHRISARKFSQGSGHTFLMDISISFHQDIIVLSVEVVQNSDPAGMFSRHEASEIAFFRNLFYHPCILPAENAFRLR